MHAKVFSKWNSRLFDEQNDTQTDAAGEQQYSQHKQCAYAAARLLGEVGEVGGCRKLRLEVLSGTIIGTITGQLVSEMKMTSNLHGKLSSHTERLWSICGRKKYVVHPRRSKVKCEQLDPKL